MNDAGSVEEGGFLANVYGEPASKVSFFRDGTLVVHVVTLEFGAWV